MSATSLDGYKKTTATTLRELAREKDVRIAKLEAELQQERDDRSWIDRVATAAGVDLKRGATAEDPGGKPPLALSS